MTRCEAGTGSSTVPRKAFTGGYEDVQKKSSKNRSFAASTRLQALKALN